ncbi:hypothetical protein ENSA5_31960 [Enhygromyxa salina]|uniref:Uncharacterized protein n=1 Tax=Enhygromyxa salina TaxID=215803 RepID=A0A2S9XXU4_9BACT|nr:hypothetical protein [Enhygromyxa salina]PRP97689.1 hypothetical protein ENSA5_31960 [Enhygromyxa salina]
MANEPSKESSLFPSNDDERENSGLQDILAVAAKIKDKEDDPASAESEMNAEDSGLILFTAGGDDVGETKEEDDDALFGSFAGGLGAGFGAAAADPLSSSTDVVPLASTSEAAPATATAEEPKRNPLVAVAVVLGLVLAGGAAVLLTDKGAQPVQDQAQAGVSAKDSQGDAAVGKVEEPSVADAEPAEGGGPALEPEPEPEPEPEGETEGLLAGETEGAGLLADADAADPMAQKEGLLENDGSNGVAKVGKWDQGKSSASNKPAPDSNAAPAPEPEPEPEPEFDPLPEPQPSGSGGKVSEEDVDCLLNPDMPKCQSGAAPKPKEQEVLAPKVPDKLSTSQLRSGMNKIKSAAKKCGGQHGVPPGTKVKVKVSIEGSTGTVSSVAAKGEHAGTPLGSCVEAAVKQATFDVFKKPSMGIDYSLSM